MMLCHRQVSRWLFGFFVPINAADSHTADMEVSPAIGGNRCNAGFHRTVASVGNGSFLPGHVFEWSGWSMVAS